MKLTVHSRDDLKKSAAKRLRREGNIPAVLYSSGEKTQMIVVDGVEFSAHLREIRTGRLPTTRFTLDFEGKTVPVIVKEIQYHPTTYQIRHLDFLALQEKAPVKVKVPVVCVGMERCQGIKLGGYLRQVMHHIPTVCSIESMPSHFVVDVGALNMQESKRVSDIQMPKGVEALVPQGEVVVVIAKR